MFFLQLLIPVANAFTETSAQPMVESFGFAPYDPFDNLMRLWFWAVLLIIAPFVCFFVAKSQAKKMAVDVAFSAMRQFFRLLVKLLVATFLCSFLFIVVDRLVDFFHNSRSLAIDLYDLKYFVGRFYIIFSTGCFSAGAALLLYVRKNARIFLIAIPLILIFVAMVIFAFINSL